MNTDLSAMRLVQQHNADERRQAASLHYPAARDRLRGSSMQFLQHSDAHYSVRHNKGWRLDVYPGNLRLTGSGKRPHLKLPADWTLVDVAEAVLAHEAGNP